MRCKAMIFTMVLSMFLGACSAAPSVGTVAGTDVSGSEAAPPASGSSGEIVIHTDQTGTTDPAGEDSGKELPKGSIIEDQSFDVNLDGWGNVRFVSYAPDEASGGREVSFYLMKDGKIIYTFPGGGQEYVSSWMFDSVKMVSFQDVNGDGRKDVIAVISYITGIGPQGTTPFPTTRIWIAGQDGFTLDDNLSKAVDDHHANQDIHSIMDFIHSKTADTGNGDSDRTLAAPAATPSPTGTPAPAGTPSPAGDDEVYRLSGIHEKDAREFLQEFTDHIAGDEKKAASDMILFPRKLEFPQKEVVVQDSDEFLAYYDQVFTPDFKARLEKDSKGEIFGTDTGAAMGDGDVWITSADGRLWVEAIHNDGQCSVVYPGKPGVQHE